ncbi:hypothetical protein ACXRSW_22550 [Aeromonas dhakensis]|jgi:large subunit ribosomal protein L21|nr:MULTISPECIES: hypothetical protein [Aeromonas]NJI07722.1 hypothetical protein [Aeromonas veronii]CAD7498374.1 hypothetical protein KBAD45_P250 [Aeromonas dhakensis]CAD7543342.1 hypothetical protein KBAD11_P250 [Aeromonas dhakensis]CAD7543358.1 hypothetical protein KBAD59_P280 [Aeromonas dhakensis]CAD7554878.1 hypothetical protein KBAD10_P280 [Aeromonas dhakensis]
MGIEYDQVNFSQDYELNDHLKKASKSQSAANRTVLVKMGDELKKLLGVSRLTHKQFDDYIAKNLSRLAN